jgi:ribosomal protein L37AE/L43A
MGSLKEETIAKLAGKKTNPEESVDGIKKQAEDMTVIDHAMETARKLSGAGVLKEELDHEHKKVADAEQQRDKAIEDKHKAQIEKVQSELGAKIDTLANSYTRGVSKESIADQIAEIKKAAAALDMGGSKVSELKEMMNLITTLNPHKSMVDQIRDAKELITAIAPQPGKPNEFSIGGMPAAIALEIKKMDINLQTTLETMKDERERRAQEFALRIKQFDLERQDKISEAQGKIQVEQERNKMISGGLETVGRAIGHGLADGSREVAPGSIGARQTESPKSYHIELNENQADEFDCPKCAARIAVGPTTTVAQCVGCQSKFPVVRKSASQMPETQPPEEE